ncbi:MAG: DUF4097 family beta strand repeat protein, partial [Clostridia bacterium]|nr:DUF4097 family beta strand repeat protein [Clostridia bacterium]
MNKSKFLLVALIVVLLCLVSGTYSIFGGKVSIGLAAFANADKYTVGDTEITSTVENLDIDWTSGKVNIEYHAGSGVSVSETANRDTSEDEKLRWWLDGTTLRIKYAKPQLTIFNNLKKTLTVSLPEGIVLKNVDIDTTSADIGVPSMTADEIKFDTTSGDVNAVITAKKLSASSTSGDLNVRQDSDINTAHFSSTSGALAFTVPSAEKISMESTSGDISVTVPGTVGDLNLDSTSGSIKPDIANTDKAKFSSTSGDITATLVSFKDLNVDVTSGDVTLKLPEISGFTLDLDARPSKLKSSLAMVKKGDDQYVFGDGSARLRVSTTSGDV